MTAGDRDEASEDEWLPTVEDADVERFKWAWSEADGELVWSVSGPGDGRPVHEEQAREVWGRGPSLATGDVVGIASYAPETGAERAHLYIRGYYGSTVPEAIVRWFSETFPGAELRERPGP